MREEVVRLGMMLPETIDVLLHTGTLSAYYKEDGVCTKYEFTYEDGYYVMRTKGLNEGADEVSMRDFARIVVNMCVGGAVYTHNPQVKVCPE